VDYFRDIEHIKETFVKFASLVPQNGYLVACADDSNTVSILNRVSCNIITYGIKSKEAMWSAENIIFNDLGHASFDVLKGKERLCSINLSVPGIHNVNNALAAFSACYSLDCNIESIKNGLHKFTGTNRRFELKGTADNIRVIDDYAHHPSEVKATLKAAKNCTHSKIWCVFQPHTYTRTKSLLNEFSTAFSDADAVIVADIYAAREPDKGEIHASTLADKISLEGQQAVYLNSFENIVGFLEENVSHGDMVITMGAGDIYKVGEMFLQNKR
jgi:UDP-N-acetylmuramate--alanine ligase